MIRFLTLPRSLPRSLARQVRLWSGGVLGGVALAASLAAATATAAAPPTCAAVLPYTEAVARTDKAARAVLARAGRESCLRGKLTNALLGLSASCQAVPGRADPACALAERAVVQLSWSLPFMEETARELLGLIGSPAPGR